MDSYLRLIIKTNIYFTSTISRGSPPCPFRTQVSSACSEKLCHNLTSFFFFVTIKGIIFFYKIKQHLCTAGHPKHGETSWHQQALVYPGKILIFQWREASSPAAARFPVSSLLEQMLLCTFLKPHSPVWWDITLLPSLGEAQKAFPRRWQRRTLHTKKGD